MFHLALPKTGHALKSRPKLKMAISKAGSQ